MEEGSCASYRSGEESLQVKEDKDSRVFHFMLLFGYHLLRGVFVSFYATRFIVAFRLERYAEKKPDSSATHRNPLDLEKGSALALLTFTNIHLKYIAFAIVKDSLPAWRALALSKWRWLVSHCRCCRSGNGGCVKRLITHIRALIHLVPCPSGVTLTIFMCLLWVPLNNIAGLAVYSKVVVSCYAVFLFAHDHLPKDHVAPKTRRDAPLVASSSVPTLSLGREASHDESPVDKERRMQGNMRMISRHSSPYHTPKNSSLRNSWSGTDCPAGVNQHDMTIPTLPPDSAAYVTTFFSPTWACELLAGVGTAVVTLFCDFGLSNPVAPSAVSVAIILSVTLVGGVCFSVGTYQSEKSEVKGMRADSSCAEAASEGKGVSTPPGGVCEAMDERVEVVVLTPGREGISEQGTGTAAENPVDQASERTFYDFYKAARLTFKSPSMKAMSAVMLTSTMHEAFTQQYFFIFLMVATPPGSELPSLWMALAFAVFWILPLFFSSFLRRWMHSRCQYEGGATIIALMATLGLSLFIFGFASALGTAANDKTTKRDGLPHLSMNLFFLFLAHLWLYGGLVGGFRRILEDVLSRSVVMEDYVVFRRCASPVSAGREAVKSAGIAEELFGLLSLIAKASAALIGCFLFWLYPPILFGATSATDGEAYASYQRQTARLCMVLGVWVAIHFSSCFIIWRILYKLYGGHKEFIENAYLNIRE